MQQRPALVAVRFFFRIITKRFSRGNGKAGGVERLAAARPGGHDQMGERKDFLKVLPRADVAKGVHAEDEIEPVAFPARGEIAERVDREGFAGAAKLDVGDGEAGIAPGRERRHAEHVGRVRGAAFFERLDRRRDEKHAVEAKSFPDLFRAPQMAPVDRIERAAEKTDSHIKKSRVSGFESREKIKYPKPRQRGE